MRNESPQAKLWPLEGAPPLNLSHFSGADPGAGKRRESRFFCIFKVANNHLLSLSYTLFLQFGICEVLKAVLRTRMF